MRMMRSIWSTGVKRREGPHQDFNGSSNSLSFLKSLFLLVRLLEARDPTRPRAERCAAMADEDSAGSGAPKSEPRADLAAPGEPRPPEPSPRQQAEPKGESSSPASPTAINTADGASAAVSGGETMAAAPKTAEDGGGGAACSFSQLLAGAMGSAAAAGAVPILAVPVDAARVSVVAVPCFIAPASLLNSPGFTGQFAMTHQAVLATVTAQAQLQLLLQQGAQPSSSSDSLTNSSPQPSGSAITTLLLQQRPPPIPEENVCTPEVEQSPSPHQKPRSSRIVLRTNSSDGYNWRKYGQKQVKSSDISRSYYRCANSDCFVKKKVQHFQDGRVIEIVYKGCHNHDPPQKTRFSKEKRSLSAGPLVESEDLEPPGGELNESHATLKAEQDCSNTSPEQQFHCSSDCEEDSGVKTEDLADKPEPKRRLCEITAPSLAPLLKTVKESKIVMQSAGDLGLVNDGYKWRKYGQKFVKGNSNPRSYYRCTQVGCPVRKHVERSKDDAAAFRITYEGKHNHDQPSPRNGGDPPTAAVPAATAAVTNAGQIETSRCLSDQKPMPEQWHHADEKINDDKRLGREKALESAQTLLSIGEASRNNSEGIPRPLFDENHAAVPVQNS